MLWQHITSHDKPHHWTTRIDELRLYGWSLFKFKWCVTLFFFLVFPAFSLALCRSLSSLQHASTLCHGWPFLLSLSCFTVKSLIVLFVLIPPFRLPLISFTCTVSLFSFCHFIVVLPELLYQHFSVYFPLSLWCCFSLELDVFLLIN